ncbi:hypothetical protein NX786_17920 [Telluria mixta]|uniref:Uncharacterized protein n=1 Tax=Telluria mixta TaxID=34071 RepID=A0ABT2C1F6_9BURK|nr:hypothetical protein [Telluria mixta]MCS0631215.1 hypothetical protein [Telluria mixta]WEM95754.1 hypothetical protein P0M04_30515 [Telluria mixta]
MFLLLAGQRLSAPLLILTGSYLVRSEKCRRDLRLLRLHLLELKDNNDVTSPAAMPAYKTLGNEEEMLMLRGSLTSKT